jgi:hypothetical protein
MAEAAQTDVQENVVAHNPIDIVTNDAEITSLDDAVEAAAPEEIIAEAPEADTGDDGDTPDDEGEAAETDEGESDEEDAEEAETAEIIEFDFGGNKLEVPKDSVPPELATKIAEFTKGTWATFTKGQQDNAEHATALGVRETTVAKLNALNGEALQTYSHGLQLRAELEQLAQVDMNMLWQSDPDRARQLSDLHGAKQAEFQDTIARVGQQEEAVEEAQAESKSRRIEEGRSYLDKHIKGFTATKHLEVVDYVTSTYAMPRAQAEQWALNPVVTRMAYKAMILDRQTGAAKRSLAKPAQARPVKSPASSGAATGAKRSPDDMSLGQLSKHLGLISA